MSGTKFMGDGDPLDVVEVGDDVLPCGSVVAVKVVGALALVDEGELDWKIITIAECCKNSKKINDIDDVNKVMPGKLDDIRDWYRLYKTADGKGENEYAFEGKFFGRKKALEIINDAHKSWNANRKPSK